MSKSYKVSVLMPVFNSNTLYLRKAIESILSQTYEDFEFIILNDASTNVELEKIILSYDDPRIVYIKNNENKGISFSRNRLIEESNGTFWATMDHDDISAPDRLEKQVNFLEKHPNVDVVGCWMQFINQNTIEKYPIFDEEIQKELLVWCSVSPPVMVRKSTLQKLNAKYDSRYFPAEDYALWCSLIGKVVFANIPEVLFFYRMHEMNTTSLKLDRMKYMTRVIQEEIRNLHPLLWKRILEQSKTISRIKLFGVIPLLKIERQNDRKKYSIFDKIPFFSSRTKKFYHERNLSL